MKTWLDLLALRFLTSRDGLPALWKVNHLFMCTIWGAVVVVSLIQGTLPLVIWPAMTFGIMLTGASHGLRGYQAFVDSKAAADVKANTDTKLTGDLAAIAKEVLQRRASSDHPGTEPAP